MPSYGALVPGYASPHTAQMLAVVHYNHGHPTLMCNNGVLHVCIPSTATQLAEYWYVPDQTSHQPRQTECHVTGNEGWCADGENLFAACLIPDGPELAHASKQAYEHLIKLAHTLGYINIYRIWNYIGSINAPNSNGLERYRDFCLGRAEAFETLNYAPASLPAATGIGLQEGGVVVFLIARKTPQATNIENPLQVPAYQYPQRYGPKAPSFARATAIETQNSLYLYVSGTASIRNHVSLCQNLNQQTCITIENIQTLLDETQKKFPAFTHVYCDTLKIYVRHAQDIGAVADAFQNAFCVKPEHSPTLISDICREELSLEVEGVFRFQHNPVL